jgi:hypothetical protein
MIAAELEVIAKAHGVKKVTPELVVAAAAAPTHPLHRFFEWDDSIAAMKWRLDQAARMIAAVKYVRQAAEERARPPTVRLCHLREWIPDGSRTNTYCPRDVVMAEPDARAAWIAQRIATLRSWCGSVVDVRELDSIRICIEAMLDEYDAASHD